MGEVAAQDERKDMKAGKRDKAKRRKQTETYKMKMDDEDEKLAVVMMVN